ncbi:MAG TPA: DUF2293 domain-containing protein [Candidatus Dormibacteraeota bacterium]|nr:DUF2293 domain-containing protein [Candidatus Dormibacteraeota bacterium]
MNENVKQLQVRVERAAEVALAQKKYVSPIDVLVGIHWLPQSVLDEWRQGRLPSLERGIEVNLHKLSTAMHLFRSWATRRGLVPSETAYVARNRRRQPLRFSVSGQEGVERGYRTHWVPPELSAQKRQWLTERQSRPPDLVAILPLNDWTCSQCGGTGAFLLMEEPGPVCLTCADMDHLVFLPAGDATLSRRAKKASRLSLVVVRFSRARKRYERQGILIEEAALERAEDECLADEDARARQRLRAAERRSVENVAFRARFAREIRNLFPGCPGVRAEAIALHAAARGSGRVGRSAAGRALDEEAVRLAAVASVRHQDTMYDELLMSGVDRGSARDRVRDAVEAVLEVWERRVDG